MADSAQATKSKGTTAKAAGPGGKAAVGAEPLPPVKQLQGRLAAGGLAPLLAAHDWQGARAGHHEAVLNHLKALPAGGFLDALHGLADAAASGHPHARGWAQWAAANRPAGPEVGKAEFGHRASVVDTSKLPEDEQAHAQGVLRSLPRLAGTGHPVAPAGFNYAGLLGEGVTSRPAGKGDLAMSHALASRPVHEQVAAYLPSPEQVSAAATAKGQAEALDANLQRVVHLAAGGERAGWEYAAGKGPADLRHAGMLHQSGQTVKPELDVKHLRGTTGRVKGAQENVRNKLAEATEDPRRLKASLAFNLAEDQPEEKRGAFLKFGVGGFTPGGKGSTQLLTHAEVQKLGTKEGAKLLRQRLESAFGRADLEGYGEELEKQKARMGKADARNISKTLHSQTGDLAANFEAMFGDKPTPAMLKRLGEMRHYAAEPRQATQFPNPVKVPTTLPFAQRPYAYPGVTALHNAALDHRVPITELDPAGLLATQDFLVPDKTAQMQGPLRADRPIVAVRHGGKTYIEEGHHRVAHALRLGSTVPARVIEPRPGWPGYRAALPPELPATDVASPTPGG